MEPARAEFAGSQQSCRRSGPIRRIISAAWRPVLPQQLASFSRSKRHPAAEAIEHIWSTRSIISSGKFASSPRRKPKIEIWFVPKRSAHSQARGSISVIPLATALSETWHLNSPGETPDTAKPASVKRCRKSANSLFVTRGKRPLSKLRTSMWDTFHSTASFMARVDAGEISSLNTERFIFSFNQYFIVVKNVALFKCKKAGLPPLLVGFAGLEMIL